MLLWQWAREYTLADHFFQAAFGGSFFNHFWLVCACTPEFPNAPQSIRAQLDEQGRLKRRPTSPASVMDGPVQVFDGQVTPDGYAVNTSQPPYQPSGVPPAANGDANLADAAGNPVPPQTRKTIGDTLSAKGVSWAWYSGGWNAALADGRQDPKAKRAIIYNRDPSSPNFQAHHQPLNYFARFAPGTQDRAQHLKDGDDFLRDIDAGTLPHVALYKPVGRNTQHPSYTDVATGDRHIAGVLERLRKSPQWDRMVVVVTYDENGGYWDHVPPPRGPGWGDRWGPGSRVPAIIVSPFAKKGYVDKTPYDTTSIIKLITRRFALEPLPGVRSTSRTSLGRRRCPNARAASPPSRAAYGRSGSSACAWIFRPRRSTRCCRFTWRPCSGPARRRSASSRASPNRSRSSSRCSRVCCPTGRAGASRWCCSATGLPP